MSQIFELPYHIENNGDGSASVEFHKTMEEAEKADEDLEEGWGEDCSSSVDLKIEDGKLFFRKMEYQKSKVVEVWIELTPQKPKKVSKKK